MSDLRTFTLWARELLTKEAGELLQQVYRLDSKTGTPLQIPPAHILETSPVAQTNRARIEKLIADEIDAGFTREEATVKLIRETAFTHLNRFVAFKLMEAGGLVRSPLAKHHSANGFRMWLATNPAFEALYNEGDSPHDRDGFDEAPRDRAYRNFLLWQCGELAKEINVLFDPTNLPSLLFPRPGALKELIDALNADDRKSDWVAGNEATVGWVYQYFNAEEKAAAFDRVFKKKKKFEKTDLAAATQIFTPRWIVRYLVENSLGRLWITMHPETRLTEALAYLVPLSSEPSTAESKLAKDIRVLDPATGTMHFGLVAFDLLAEMYREELANAGTAGWPALPSVQNEAEIPATILANNLFGIDIDLRAVQLAALALYLKAKATNKGAVLKESNLACADVALFRGQHLTRITSEMNLPGGFTRELFSKFRESLEEASMMGSLVRLDQHFKNFQSDRLRLSVDAYVEKKRAEGVDESYFANETGKGLRLLNILEQRYDVVFTNPPYMSNRNMNPTMSEFMKRNYKDSKGDLYAAFIERCAELLKPEGRMAMIAQQSFMFISSFEDLRALLLGATVIESMAHVGPRAFAEVTGEKVNTTAFVLRRELLAMERRAAKGIYFRLVKEPDADSKRTAFEQALSRRRGDKPDSRVYDYCQGDFVSILGHPWVYQITPSLLKLFAKSEKSGSFSSKGVAKQGLATADNPRFIRFWWEVKRESVGRGYLSRNDFLLSAKTWCPHMKGGGDKTWLANNQFVINWSRNGAELIALQPKSVIRSPNYYFKPGITYNAVSSRAFRGMPMPAGCIFDSAGDCVFPNDSTDLLWMLGLLNSEFARGILTMLNPTLNVYTSDLDRLPVPASVGQRLAELSSSACEAAAEYEAEDEATYNFIEPPSWPDGLDRVVARQNRIASLEREIDQEVYHLYGISSELDFIHSPGSRRGEVRWM